MNEPIYDFTFKVKYRKIHPAVYTCIFVLGLSCIPTIIYGVVAVGFFVIKDVDPEFANIFFTAVIFMVLIPLLFLIFTVRLWRSEVNNRYVFYDSKFKVISGKSEIEINYSDIIEIKEIKEFYFLYISKTRTAIMGKQFDNVTPDEFERFLIEKTKIKPKKFNS